MCICLKKEQEKSNVTILIIFYLNLRVTNIFLSSSNQQKVIKMVKLQNLCYTSAHKEGLQFLCTISPQMVRIKHPHLGTNKHILLPTMFMVSWTQAVWKEGASAETSQLYTPAASNSRLVRTTWVALLSLFCNKEPTPRFSQPCIGGCFFPDGFARVTTPPFHRVLFLAAFLKLGGTEVSFGKGYTGNSFGGCVYS